jgi:hypothetical protein
MGFRLIQQLFGYLTIKRGLPQRPPMCKAGPSDFLSSASVGRTSLPAPDAGGIHQAAAAPGTPVLLKEKFIGYCSAGWSAALHGTG